MIFTRKTTNTLPIQQIGFYRSLDFVKVWNFYKAEETGDYRYLLKLDDYEVLPKYSNMLELTKVFEGLKMEALQISIDKDRKSNNIFRKQKQVQELENDYNIIQLIIDILSLDKDEKYIKYIADNGYRIDIKKDYYKELKRISKSSKSMLNKINILNNDIKELTKTSQVTTTAWDEIESIGAYLKEDIDIHKMSMTMYLIKKYKVLNAIHSEKK